MELSRDLVYSTFSRCLQGTLVQDVLQYMMVGQMESGTWWISLGHGPLRLFDVNIEGDVFYSLHLEIPREFRGQGHGARLYLALENIARDLGCEQIRRTPSGTTYHRETRADYLIRRFGYRKDGVEVVKDLQLVA